MGLSYVQKSPRPRWLRLLASKGEEGVDVLVRGEEGYGWESDEFEYKQFLSSRTSPLSKCSYLTTGKYVCVHACVRRGVGGRGRGQAGGG